MQKRGTRSSQAPVGTSRYWLLQQAACFNSSGRGDMQRPEADEQSQIAWRIAGVERRTKNDGWAKGGEYQAALGRWDRRGISR